MTLIADDMERVIRAISANGLSLGHEAKLQEELGQLMRQAGLPVERELSTESGDRMDYFVARSGLCIEVKANKNWSALAVYRQLERYAADSRVRGLLLLTARAQGLPEYVGGKPARVHALGEAAL